MGIRAVIDIELIDLGSSEGDLKGTPAREAGGMINRNSLRLAGAVDSLAGLNLVAGPVTTLPAGAAPTAGLTGAAPNYTLNLGLPAGPAGAGAPDAADLQAIPRYAEVMDRLRSAAVPDVPSVLLDFLGRTHFVRNAFIGASIAALMAALPGSSFTRASTATYVDSDGLMKTAAVNAPRYDYDPATRQPLGLLIETASTNLLSYSAAFENAAWTKLRASITANAATAPDGTLTADKWLEDTTASATHSLYRSLTGSVGTRYTYSLFVKAAERTNLRLQLDDGSSPWTSTTFDLAAGTFASNVYADATAGMINIGNGWWRLWVSGLATSTTVRGIAWLSNGGVTYTGDGVSGLLVWGAQIETGDLSSYIPTVASAVTRAADDFILTLGALISPSEQSIVSEFVALAQSTATITIATLGSADNSENIRHYLSGTSARYLATSANATLGGVVLGGTYTYGAVGRLASATKASDYIAAFNGGLGAPVTTGAGMPTSAERLCLGRSNTGSSRLLAGYIRQLMIFPTRLANAKLQALTSPATWS